MENYPNADQTQQQATAENPDKSYLVALTLSYLLGSFGADRFYLGKIGTGIVKLITFGGLGIWQLVDLLLLAFNKLHAKGDDRALEGYAKNRSWVKIVSVVLIVFNLLFIVGAILLFTLFSVPALQRNAEKVESQSQTLQQSDRSNQFDQYDAPIITN